MSEARMNVLALACCAVAYVAIAVYLEAGGGPQRPDKIVWQDTQRAEVRVGPPGSFGAPHPDPIPLPASPCAWQEGANYLDATGWWHVITQSPRSGRCYYNGPPPLEVCNKAWRVEHADNPKKNGYFCRPQPGGVSVDGGIWMPETRP